MDKQEELKQVQDDIRRLNDYNVKNRKGSMSYNTTEINELLRKEKKLQIKINQDNQKKYKRDKTKFKY
jgi:hypothetical protein